MMIFAEMRLKHMLRLSRIPAQSLRHLFLRVMMNLPRRCVDVPRRQRRRRLHTIYSLLMTKNGTCARSEETDEFGCRRQIIKIIESSFVKVPPMPSAANLDSWRLKLIRALTNASGYDDQKERAWVSEILEEGKKLADFRDHGGDRFKSLDEKLGVAMLAMLENGAPLLFTKGNRYDERAGMDGTVLMAGMAGRIMFGWFMITGRSISNMRSYYTLHGLGLLVAPGDDHLAHFDDTWSRVVEQNLVSMPEEQLMYTLIQKLGNKSAISKHDIEYIYIYIYIYIFCFCRHASGAGMYVGVKLHMCWVLSRFTAPLPLAFKAEGGGDELTCTNLVHNACSDSHRHA